MSETPTEPAPPEPEPEKPAPSKNPLTSVRLALLAGGPWPIVVLMLAGLASFVAIVLWAPPSTHDFLFGAHGLFFTILGYLVASPLEK